jgi:hypothetical protein
VYEKAMNVVEDVKIGDHLRCFIQKTIWSVTAHFIYTEL